MSPLYSATQCSLLQVEKLAANFPPRSLSKEVSTLWDIQRGLLDCAPAIHAGYGIYSIACLLDCVPAIHVFRVADSAVKPGVSEERQARGVYTHHMPCGGTRRGLIEEGRECKGERAAKKE